MDTITIRSFISYKLLTAEQIINSLPISSIVIFSSTIISYCFLMADSWITPFVFWHPTIVLIFSPFLVVFSLVHTRRWSLFISVLCSSQIMRWRCAPMQSCLVFSPKFCYWPVSWQVFIFIPRAFYFLLLFIAGCYVDILEELLPSYVLDKLSVYI